MPVRVLAEALGATVDWNPATGVVSVNGGGSATTQPDYNREDKLYWLSRIISAESRGEPLEGQIAVGNVVLNRVDSPDFPDTIYGVIFDDRWGGQFTPVRNGTIYQEAHGTRAFRRPSSAWRGSTWPRTACTSWRPALTTTIGFWKQNVTS